ncbi:MAG: prepilin-type N-terminal cleavage/methylation domain-containing protein [Nitrospirae bacterium]|nr:prepilin-type N-terminal cleavage/methylation domain-containing protein [Nitrospirota bacterium]
MSQTMQSIDNKGFTLIELMVVIAVVSLLTSIAVPMFLGQRDKAKVSATLSGASSGATDLQYYLDSYIAGDPYVILTDATGTQGCFESNNSSATGLSCLSVFNQASTGTYAAYPGGMTTVISHFISHHTFKADQSAFRNNLTHVCHGSLRRLGSGTFKSVRKPLSCYGCLWNELHTTNRQPNSLSTLIAGKRA